MKKKTAPPTPTPESLAIKSALAAMPKGAGAALAAALELTPGAVSQWATARRPVPPALAPVVASFLGLEPHEVSKAYATIAPRVAEDRADYSSAVSPEVQRAPNDIRAINMALGALMAAMVKHRPAEALDVAASLRRVAPKAFRERGLVLELLTTLDAAGAVAKQRGG